MFDFIGGSTLQELLHLKGKTFSFKRIFIYANMATLLATTNTFTF